MKPTHDTTMNVLPVRWIRAEHYCAVSGESLYTVQERIRDGIWAAGLHYKRTGPRTLWINLHAVTQWIEQQPHIETTAFPKESKSAKASADRACA